LEIRFESRSGRSIFLSAEGLSRGRVGILMTVTASHILQTSVGPRIVLFTGVIQRQRGTVRISSPSSRSSFPVPRAVVRISFITSAQPSRANLVHARLNEASTYKESRCSLPFVGNREWSFFFCFHSVISPMCIFVNASWAPLLLRIQAVCGRRKSNQDDHEKRRRLWTSEFTVIQRSECIGRDVCLHSWVVVLAYSSGKRKVWRFAGQRLLLRSF